MIYASHAITMQSLKCLFSQLADELVISQYYSGFAIANSSKLFYGIIKTVTCYHSQCRFVSP